MVSSPLAMPMYNLTLVAGIEASVDACRRVAEITSPALPFRWLLKQYLMLLDLLQYNSR